MLRSMILLLALNSCAPAVVRASSLPSCNHACISSGPVMLDEVAVRELLAGVELELGDERAKMAAANQNLETWQKWGPIGIIIGMVIGAIAGVVASH